MKVFCTKTACNFVLQPSKHEEIPFPREFILVFIMYFVEGDIVERIMSKVWGVEKKEEVGHIVEGLSIE